MAAIAAGGVEQVLAPPGSWIVEVPSCRNGERLSIERDIPDDIRAHLDMSGVAARAGSAGAGLAGEQVRGHAHVAVVGARGLLQQVRSIRLPTKPADRLPPVNRIVHDVCPARDPIAIEVPGIRAGEYAESGDGLEQSQTKHHGSDSR